MKRYTLLLLVLLSISGYAQNTINNYKYVIVPEKFNFLKQNDQYKLNTLTKALLEDKGFSVYFDNADLPKDIANNKCNALTVEVLEKNSMFSTNLTILLKDCYGKTVFETKQGKSREKEYTVSYNLALRDAFTSITETPYAYQPASVPAKASVPVSVPSANVTTAVSNTSAKPTESKLTPGTLYAQPTATGYQLIDTAPKIILTLYKTSVDDYFIADNGSSNGIVFKKNDSWVFEYYHNGQLIAEKLLIKF